ncbi:MAG TPA: tudor domain-containing protein [Sandaracinaceae bacterium]
MRLAVLSIASLASACLGPRGPELPPDVGTSHAGGTRRAEAEQPPEAPARPVEVGTPVWANFHDSGFYFHGVVVERRGDVHRVIYGDGASEWLPASALLPDALADDAQVHVRPSVEGEFGSATIARRLGNAVYVRLASGDERWTALPHVRFQAGAPGTPRRDQEPLATGPVPSGEIGSDVLVDYQMQGLRFAATVTAHREDGRVHVVYLDGESEWTPRETISPENVGPGTVVHVRRSWEPPVWVRGTVRERYGQALRVELDDGGIAWTTMLRIRVPSPEPVPAAAPPAEPEAPPEPARAREPRRRRR